MKNSSRAMTLVLLLAAAALLLHPSAAAATSDGIDSSHWAYRAIGDWAERGLLAGYPAGEFQGPVTLTRYEAAALTLRAARGVGQNLREEGERLENLSAPDQTAVEGEDENSALTEAIAAIERPPGVYPEDIAMLEKLVAEFRTELAALGTRVDKLESLLAGMETRLAAVEEERRRHQISGYLQFWFRDDEAGSASDFSVRRARVSLAGPLSERTSYTLEFQADEEDERDTAMRYGWIDFKLSGNSRLRAGQARLPMGYELMESSAARLEPERAFVMDRLFPDQGDIGIQWHRQVSPNLPAVDLAVVNGTGINASDDNDRKDVVAALVLPCSGGSFTVAAYEGRTGRGAATQDKDRLLAGLEIGDKETRLRGEYVRGRDLGQDVMGWYARLARQVTPTGTLYVKYEEFDEDCGCGGDLFQRWSAGWVEELDPRTRLTLAWESRSAGNAFSEHDDFVGDAAVLQLQARF